MAKVNSIWYYEASVLAKETIEDTTVEKATQKAHLQSKPSANAKFETSDFRLLKKQIKLEDNDDDRTEKDKGSGSQKTKGSG
jgi:hypothetical protein